MILTIDEAKTLGRPLGDIKADKLNAYMREVEQTQIKPMLGDALYRDINDDTMCNADPIKTLLNGGTYTDRAGEYRTIVGLKTAIAYYTYVKVMMSGDIESTRYGMMLKDGQYSQHVSNSARAAAYNEATEVGNRYMSECIDYCRSTGLLQTSKRAVSYAGCTIKKIG